MFPSSSSTAASTSIPLVVLDALGTQSAVISLGVTTAVLLVTTYYYYLSRTKSSRTTTTTTMTGRLVGDKSMTASSLVGKDGDGDIEVLDASKYPGGRLTVYYGSQTGTAQMFARQIAEECEHRGFKCDGVIDLQDVVDNDDCDIEGTWNDDGEGVEYDGEVKLIRATLANPRHRDPDVGGGGGGGDGIGGGGRGGGRSKAVFLVATYGEGEPTDNAQQFVEIMKRKSGIRNIYDIGATTTTMTTSVVEEKEGGEDEAGGGTETTSESPPVAFLADVDYAVFGLGNKQYEHYNNMGRFVDASLGRCGARRVADLGLGDDDDDLEGDFENWKDGVLWPSLISRYVGVGGGDGSGGERVNAATTGRITHALPPCPYTVDYCDSRINAPDNDDRADQDAEADVSPSDMIQTSSRHYVQAVDCPIIARRELRDSSDPGSTVHIEIDISRRMDVMKYHTADNLGILPKNDSTTVEAVARALNYDLDRRFRLVPKNDGGCGSDPNSISSSPSSSRHTLPFPTPCTVRHCLERYCDLTGSPRRSDLKQLASYAVDDLDRRALLRMSSKEGKAEYREKIVDAHVGIADIVTRLCPSISCPLEHFIMACPRLQPRYYTVSSSSMVHPTTIHITLAVLETERRNVDGDVKVFRGLCSGYLAGLKTGDTVSAFVRESTFRLPRQIERPVIMFGPGTGIAPMRAILQERSHMCQTMEPQQRERIGASILYFGCKNRSMDYIYQDELEAFLEERTLTELHLAFSREKADKVYVQHLLANRGEETWKLIRDENAFIFVCGAVRMGADVSSTLQDIISQEGGMNRDKAKIDDV
ncbi:hypothetical protein ACHAXA_002282 [Cyclostephanos tholiformis]|uniref:NADPH--hemoprotein reductase n=1 Tax=Cyclostephanos tholiformis TaxID=382380 RepID=A0ABD3RTA3_9STRA